MFIYTVKNDIGDTQTVDADKIDQAVKDGYLPVVSNKEGDQQRVSPKDLHLALADGYKPVEGPTAFGNISAPKALGLGIANAATLGLSDEGAGAQDVAMDYGQRALNTLGLADKSPGQVAQELKERGFKGDLGPSTAGDIYKAGRDDIRLQNKQAQNEHPMIYGGGQLAGAMALPVGAAQGATALSRIGSGVVKGALGGAGYGFGNSEASDASGLAKDTGTGAAVGGILGGGISSIGEGLRAGSDKAKSIINDYLEQKAASTKIPDNSAVEGLQDQLKNLKMPEYKEQLEAKLSEAIANKSQVPPAPEPLSAMFRPADATGQLIKNHPELVGMAVGSVKGPIGAAFGLAGSGKIPGIVDKLQPAMNSFDSAFQNTIKTLPEKYQSVMQSAGERGAQSQAVAHFLLGQKDPEYQQLIKDKNEDGTINQEESQSIQPSAIRSILAPKAKPGQRDALLGGVRG